MTREKLIERAREFVQAAVASPNNGRPLMLSDHTIVAFMAEFALAVSQEAVKAERERFWKELQPIYESGSGKRFDEFIQVEFRDELMREQEQEAMHGHR